MEENELRDFARGIKEDIRELITEKINAFDEKFKGAVDVLKKDISFLKDTLSSLSKDHDMIIQTYSTVDILDEREGRHNDEVKSNLKELGKTVTNAMHEMSKTVTETMAPIKTDVENLKTDVQDLKTEKGVKGGIFRNGLTIISLLIAIGAFIKSIWKP